MFTPVGSISYKNNKVALSKFSVGSYFSVDCDLVDSMEKINLKDVVTFFNRTWNKLGQETLAKCWTNILNLANLKDDDENDVTLSVLKTQMKAESKRMEKVDVEILEGLSPEV